jgi:hypothetical protein
MAKSAKSIISLSPYPTTFVTWQDPTGTPPIRDTTLPFSPPSPTFPRSASTPNIHSQIIPMPAHHSLSPEPSASALSTPFPSEDIEELTDSQWVAELPSSRTIPSSDEVDDLEREAQRIMDVESTRNAKRVKNDPRRTSLGK